MNYWVGIHNNTQKGILEKSIYYECLYITIALIKNQTRRVFIMSKITTIGISGTFNIRFAEQLN